MKAQLKTMERNSLIMMKIETKRTLTNPKGEINHKDLVNAAAEKLETFTEKFKVEVQDAKVTEVLAEEKGLKSVVRTVRVEVQATQIYAEVV